MALDVDENDLHLLQPKVAIHIPSSLPIKTLDFCSQTVTGLITGFSQWYSCNQLECVLQKMFFKTFYVNIKWTHVGIAMMDWQKAQNNFWIFYGHILVFSVNWVHILTWGEMDAMWWLAESDIILKQKDNTTDSCSHEFRNYS